MCVTQSRSKVRSRTPNVKRRRHRIRRQRFSSPLFHRMPRWKYVSKTRLLEVQGIIPQSYLATASLVVETERENRAKCTAPSKMPTAFPGAPSWAQ